MQMPHNGFDSLAAVARLNYDDTSHHRERWPSLVWVWDELDELRRCQDEAIDPDDHQKALDELDELRADAAEALDHDDPEAALDEREAALDERDALTEQRDALSEAVRLLLEFEPDMERVQAILMGGWS